MNCLVMALGAVVGLQAPPAVTGEPAGPADCAAIEADGARLACYDGLFRRAAPGDRAAAAPAATAADAESKFGLTQRAPPASERVAQIESRVVDVGGHKSGRPVLTLANGQHWSPVEPVDFGYFRPGDQITIRPAALGSFLATRDGLNRTVRIRRID